MILLTGHRGFIGSHLVPRLPAPVEFLPGRLEDDLSGLRDQDIDQVIHLASAVPPTNLDYMETNVRGTERLLAALPKNKLRYFVLMSSVSVYAGPDFEENSQSFIKTPYGESKLFQEKLVREFCGEQIPLLILRPSSVYGPGMNLQQLLPKFIQQASLGQNLVIESPKNYTQNFIAVKDIVDLVIRGLDDRITGTFNAFSDDTFSIEKLAEIIIKVLNPSVKIELNYRQDLYMTPTFANIKIKQALPEFRFRSLEQKIPELARQMK